MKVKIKRLQPQAVIPKYSKAGDAGMDLVATSQRYIPPYIEYGTDLVLEIPEGYVGLVFPRSSISELDLSLANSVGVIDSGYRGEVKCRFKRLDSAEYTYKIGDRIAQLIIIPIPNIEFEESEELTKTERNWGGFGSTN